MIELHENIYGHKNRVLWFTNFITKEEEVLEFGCGTGVMVSAFLLQEGYNMYGVDLDCPSVELGQKFYNENGLDGSRLMCKDIADLEDERFDTIIATEVFEHIEKEDIDAVIELINNTYLDNFVFIIHLTRLRALQHGVRLESPSVP